MRSVELLQAIDDDDDDRIRALGWGPVLEALRAWRKRLDREELRTFATILGDEDPEQVARAIRDLAGEREFRPGAAEIMVHMRGGHVPKPGDYATQPGRRVQPRVDQTERAYAAVLTLVSIGERTCECFPRPANVTVDRDGVLWCPDCHGLEPGQVDQAIEHAT